MSRTANTPCADTYLTLFFACLLLLSAPPGWGQTPSPAPSPTPASDSGIPLTEIAARAEQVKRPMREIARRLTAGAPNQALADQLQTLEGQINAQAKQLEERLAAKPTLYELRELDRGWKTLSAEVGRLQSNLAQQLAAADSDLRWLSEEMGKWATSLDRIHDADSLEAVFDRVRSTIAELQNLHEQTQDRISSLLLLQDRVSQQDFLVTTKLDDLATARQQFQGTMLARDSRPLWSAFSARAEDGNGVGTRGKSFVHELALAKENVIRHKQNYILLLILFVTVLWLNVSLARRIDSLTADSPALRRSAAILKRPISVALLITLLAYLGFSPNLAGLVNSVMALVLLIPFLLVVRSLVEPPAWLRIPFFALALLYLSDQIRFLADIEPLIERLIFLAESAVAIVVIFWMLRPARFAQLSASPAALKWLRWALYAVLGVLAVSLLANVFGLVTLAKVLGEGALHSAYLGGLLYGAARVVSILIAMLLRTNRAGFSAFVRLHRNEISLWVARACYFAAGLLWLFGTLEMFTVREQFIALLSRILNASLGFRSLRISLGDVLAFLLVAALAYYLAKIVRIVLQEDVLTRVPLKRGVPQALATAAQYLLLFAGFVMAVSAAGFDLNRLTLLTGAFGVGIGFGLQNIVNNFVSGLILLFERPVQVGDAVQVGGVAGDVMRIGIRSSTIRTYQGAEVIVPNAKLISEEVTNWTLSSQTRRVEIPVGVAYGTEPEVVIDLLAGVAKSDPDVLANPAPFALFTGFGDSTLQFELRFWTAIEIHPLVRSRVAIAVAKALESAGIQIPFPQRELRLKLDNEAAGIINTALDVPEKG